MTNRKFVFKFEGDESKNLYDVLSTIDGDCSEKELDLLESMEAMREFNITIILEEVK